MRSWVVLASLVWGSAAAAGDWGKSDAGAWSKGLSVGSAGKRLSVAEPVVVGDLALYPVIDREARFEEDPAVVPLAAAMRAGQVEVRETGNGVVDQLLLVNHGELPVLLRSGDVVRGGMQDRVIQDSALVAASGVPVRIRVQCVEQGRWTDPNGGRFAYGGRVDPGLREVVERAASQEATWAAVALVNQARGAQWASSWLAGRDADALAAARAEAELRGRFEDDKRVVGVVVARGGRFTGSEVYADPELFARDRLAVLGSHLSAPRPAVASVEALPSASDAAAFLEWDQGW